MFNVGSRALVNNSSSILRVCYSYVNVDLKIKANDLLTNAFAGIQAIRIINQTITKIVKNDEG